MKKSEKLLVVITLTAGLAYFGDQYGLLDKAIEIVSLDSAELEALQKRNQEYKEALDNISEINLEFQRIERVFAQAKEGEADQEGSRRAQFVAQLVGICQQVGLTNPSIDPPDNEAIPDVVEYQYITADLKIDRMPEAEFYKFLKLLEENKIIVMELDARNALDRDEIRVNCKVARIQSAQAQAKEPAA